MYKPKSEVVPRQGFISIGRKLSIPEPLKNCGHFMFSWGNVSDNIRYYQFNMCVLLLCPVFAGCRTRIQSHQGFMSIRQLFFLRTFLKLEEAVDELR